ncbi:Methionine aminopeptidase [Arcticibacter svalbardensis MN12-7]|uniref:Methionine aminopeptidase n=1 Tax=Arcticibacter svalbardensis MN12-7 TaxID=1150600 RepID=R9GUY3_9SPHI|nr:type I methionyl aminopeptidase [Arcticibacter svalbardensis]EOR95503.1 Methionine aminopeptidase [Arcticibacter svalbardensis MN12-7]
MKFYKTNEEVEIQRESCLMVDATIAEVAKILKPGITTLSLDVMAEIFMKDNGGVSSCKGYHGYPYSLCISVNEQVVHGFPGQYVLKEGDLVSIDTVFYKNGFHGDSAYTFILGETTPAILDLVRITKESLYVGIQQAIVGNRNGDIGYAIEKYTNGNHGYGVVKEMIGHGVGRQMHEDPEVPNYGRRGNGKKLIENMVLAIEPMITMKSPEVYALEDGWTIVTDDGSLAVHFEHNVCVKKGKPEILTDFSLIEQAEKSNINLNSSYYTIEKAVAQSPVLEA